MSMECEHDDEKRNDTLDMYEHDDIDDEKKICLILL